MITYGRIKNNPILEKAQKTYNQQGIFVFFYCPVGVKEVSNSYGFLLLVTPSMGQIKNKEKLGLLLHTRKQQLKEDCVCVRAHMHLHLQSRD